MPQGVNILQYFDVFFAMYTDNAVSCTHRNHTHVMVYMISGELEIKEGKERICLHRGDCAFIRKDISVQLTKRNYQDEQFKAIFMAFSTRFLRDFYGRLDKADLPEEARRSNVNIYRLPSGRPDIESLFKSMSPYFDARIQPAPEIIQLKLVEGMYILLNTDKNLYASLFDFATPWKIDILDFLEKNYMKELTIGEIANYTGRSLSSFKRDFKLCSSLTPQKWLINRRLEAARDMLAQGKRKISEVCYAVGFKNVSHFSRAYKETFGIPPTAAV